MSTDPKDESLIEMTSTWIPTTEQLSSLHTFFRGCDRDIELPFDACEDIHKMMMVDLTPEEIEALPSAEVIIFLHIDGSVAFHSC
jgi:hypothetical protein